MAIALRKINNKRHWDPRDASVQWLQADEAEGDALGDLRTKENRLSIFVIEQENEALLNRVLCALACNCEKLDRLDYLVFDPEELAALRFETEQTLGDTPDPTINPLHRDIVALSASRLAQLANALQAGADAKRKTPAEVRDLIKAAVESGTIPRDKLTSKLAAAIFG